MAPNNRPSPTVGGAQQMGLVAYVPKRSQGGKKTSKNKKKKGKRRPMGNPSASRLVVGQMARQLCSVLDPFCAHAVGARLWGDSGATSITISNHTVFEFSTSTANAVSFFFYPDWVNGYGIATASSNITTVPTPTKFPYNGSTADNIGLEGRVVSAGFIVRNVTAALNVSGSYFCIPMTRYNATDTFTGPPLLVDQRAVVVPAAKGTETAVICYRRGNGALDFRTHYTGDSTSAQPDYVPWVVYCPATPSAVNTYQVEMFVHIELLPSIATQYTLGIGNNGGRTALSDNIGAFASNVSRSVMPALTNIAGKAAEGIGKAVSRAAVRVASSAVGAYIGGPAGAAVGYGAPMILDVD